MADAAQTETEETEGTPKKKGGKLFLIIGLVLLLAGGGGGFYAVYSGLILAPATETAETEPEPRDQGPEVAFVPLDPLVVTLGENGRNSYLRFTAELEVESRYETEVAHLRPRVLDVLNGYLRAVQAQDLEAPAALARLRSQMLHRVQIVTGEGRVRDLLVTEFVLN
ncbi:flagellar basal body-associated protein FliL [Dinoroseobacter shibae DFL 12 = DSM 16493]|jgi:flagellar FliL protein|uniref:Flagellar protein FliL n=1 Tax=Dinoroseobacter shibae (strain DSM 16493 / NCIMB 14021 / DFL 12) TaxID=398580 RepID=A8LMS1_DINSH|nr:MULTISPECIES: flagellar basal body-associated FliL family protein [Dinoroseobacter]ABV94996.1 flagellar basal body-associated protein FliL [Dinoroseobacter shibae DFL 12 = DSM 16493]MDD9717883.1 flagellar basal body-associated FliL family protein [Dinoroseobacter sp. PD6]URF46415.1 flagellar basal body-associated FliL family protein [Dinoroseobacter shibae]URF50721.1 flagellar basal body-associated FliL family protein [Dinoroseobacter shibae]